MDCLGICTGLLSRNPQVKSQMKQDKILMSHLIVNYLFLREKKVQCQSPKIFFPWCIYNFRVKSVSNSSNSFSKSWIFPWGLQMSNSHSTFNKKNRWNDQSLSIRVKCVVFKLNKNEARSRHSKFCYKKSYFWLGVLCVACTLIQAHFASWYSMIS